MSPSPPGKPAALRGAWAGLAAGLWAGGLLTLQDLTRLHPAALTWASPWGYLGEAVLVGVLFYALPIAVVAVAAGALRGSFSPRGAGEHSPVRSAVSISVGLALALAAFGQIASSPHAPRWLTAPWLLESLIIVPAAIAAGWASGLAVSWALSRRRSGAALALLAILPALPAIPPLALLALSIRLPAAPGTAVASRPDIVLMTADTLRADRVNGPRARRITPSVNSVADRGVRFTDCTAHASWTNPSTASILSGLLPVDHGLRGYGGKIRPDVRTLATILRSDGYETAGIVANPLVSGAAGFSRGFQHWDEAVDRSLLARHDSSLAARLARSFAPPRPTWETMSAAEVVDRALEVLDRRGKAPLFLYLHFMDPHNPYDPPPPFAAKADPDYRGPLTFAHGTLYSILRGEIDATDRDIEHARALYDAETRYMDGEIGRLLTRLGARFAQGKIVVAFTSDHGEEFMEHGSLGHERTLYQELIHVPLIIARPGRLPEGLTFESPVAHVDLLPTLLDVAGLPPEIGLPGASLARALPGSGDGAGDLPPSILSEEDYTGYRAVSHEIRSIREGDAKIILYAPNVFGIGPWRREIFELSTDPLEHSPLSATSGKAPELPEGIESRLDAWKRRSATTEATHGKLDPERERKLKALGYIE